MAGTLSMVGSVDLQTGQIHDADGVPKKPIVTQISLYKEIKYERWHKNSIEYCKVKIEDLPRPQFAEAMDVLLDFVVDECFLSSEWTNGTIVGLKLKYLSDSEREYAIEEIVAKLTREADSPILISVPRIGLDRIREIPNLDEQIWSIVAEARLFIEGEKAQGNLFGGEP